MRCIIAGSRSICDYQRICEAIRESGFTITTVVSGGARGVDQLGERWAKENNVSVDKYIPDWSIGKVAGHIRNAKMADNADAAIFIWDGISRGTKNCINQCKSKNLPIYIKKVIGGCNN